jgi:TusA-related sulfurtransferase
MSTDLKVDETVDCVGTFCPVPIIRARDAIRRMSPGQILEVVATDPGSLGDFPAFSRNTGHELIRTDNSEKTYRYYIRVAG